MVQGREENRGQPERGSRKWIAHEEARVAGRDR